MKTMTHTFEQTINSEWYVNDKILGILESIMEEEKTYEYFMQDAAKAHPANYSINVLNRVFEER
jgi:hypothetical protein